MSAVGMCVNITAAGKKYTLNTKILHEIADPKHSTRNTENTDNPYTTPDCKSANS